MTRVDEDVQDSCSFHMLETRIVGVKFDTVYVGLISHNTILFAITDARDFSQTLQWAIMIWELRDGEQAL